MCLLIFFFCALLFSRTQRDLPESHELISVKLDELFASSQCEKILNILGVGPLNFNKLQTLVILQTTILLILDDVYTFLCGLRADFYGVQFSFSGVGRMPLASLGPRRVLGSSLAAP